jgi:hypothetical protein
MFAAGVSVQRLRRPRSTDTINPARQSLGSWDDATPVTITGAYVAAVSSFAAADPARSQVTTSKSLYCSPDADVQVGDRIVSGTHTYEVTAVPEADVNPFTGWRPVQEVPLTEVLG